jgi:hypothetical protein
VALALGDEERRILLRTLKARLDDLRAEMTGTDSPDYNVQLKHEEEIVLALIDRLDPAASEPHGSP